VSADTGDNDQCEGEYASSLDTCPECSFRWAYEDDGKRYSLIIGRVWNDRVQEWECPECGYRWPRGWRVQLGSSDQEAK
jgi:ssDNA-binding Zn-finger/Zn-ribbon topoisomerase 1